MLLPAKLSKIALTHIVSQIHASLITIENFLFNKFWDRTEHKEQKKNSRGLSNSGEISFARFMKWQQARQRLGQKEVLIIFKLWPVYVFLPFILLVWSAYQFEFDMVALNAKGNA